WLKALSDLCTERDILLIVDDVQMGCGRTGPFFSFEVAGINPDIVTISKSIRGYGLPLALTMFRTELDVWKPGEHNGTFRGNNPAVVTATAALNHYWADDAFEKETLRKGKLVREGLDTIADSYPGVSTRGRGLVQALAFEKAENASEVCSAAFESGLLLETSGPESEVVKLLPPLTTTDDEFRHGLSIIAEAVAKVMASPTVPQGTGAAWRTALAGPAPCEAPGLRRSRTPAQSTRNPERHEHMIVRTTAEITGTDREVSPDNGNWVSKRIIL